MPTQRDGGGETFRCQSLPWLNQSHHADDDNVEEYTCAERQKYHSQEMLRREIEELLGSTLSANVSNPVMKYGTI